MCTKHRDLFQCLAAPFAATEVKSRSQAGRTFKYVTARTVMNRLDAVVGPENWWDDYTPLATCTICRLSIRLPDGEVVTKVDAGGGAGMTDEGDDEKSAFSDSFKRTAVKFGVGRYLYQDGVAKLTEAQAPTNTPAGGAPPLEGGLGGRTPSVPITGPRTARAPAPTPPSKRKDEIRTGPELLEYAERCKIDPTLKGWIVGHFRKLGNPAKIDTWTDAQVAAAQPVIRKHLEDVLAAKKDQMACFDKEQTA